MTTERERLSIGIALFDGAEELDWAGPWEVLAYWAHRYPEDSVEVFTVARDNSRPIECAKGLRVLADHSWQTAPPIDVLVFPGGQGTRTLVGDEEVRAWVRSVHQRARLTTSVCTGAFVLADAGLLKGRPATTHWDDFDELLQIDGTIEARPQDRFVDEGDIITSAGISAGIDMALHLIARLHSEERAREIKRRIQYEPDPPV
ncbi:MAG TPA: DJ-1/PfpI family protein [Actinomycetota bacterium]|jgi:transcriptional regulator GlxA family with amidase domain|nr:DJ-1/PfpI family protein [Actinomycetota bacterium]